jgi:membrane-associated phospholipid phosphatase
VWIFPTLFIAAGLWLAWQNRGTRGRYPFANTPRHYRRLVTRRNLLRLGLAVGGASVLVYSGADAAFERWHTSRVKSDASDRVSNWVHDWGERYWFAVWAVIALFDAFVGRSAFTRWGRANFESLVTGLPTLWTVQRVLGASRPGETDHGPHYVPFADDNAASGHAFVSSIPFFNAWRMLAGRRYRPATLALSPLTGWSRINDRKHYASQVLLGWGIAWAATEAVQEPQPEDESATT